MKNLTSLLLLFITSATLAQKKLPIVKATSQNAVIMEGEVKNTWGINPKIQPDVHTITKMIKPMWVVFRTDIDSLRVKLKPGQKIDFIVLLNNKDTCHTRIESLPRKNYAGIRPAQHDTIPFVMNAFNNTVMKGRINGTDTLSLFFDSGTTGLLLTNEAIKNKTHLPADDDREVNKLQLGRLNWDSLRIYPVELTAQGSDGRFGWNIFDGKIVEMDYDKNLMIVHTKLPKMGAGYAKFAIEYVNNLICIHADLQVKGVRYNNRFLFDSGYQRTIMLDTLLMAEQNYPKGLEVIKKVVMKNGQGKEIPVITVNNERLNMGKAVLLNIPVQLMTGANPTRFKTHILGNEVLKRFNTIMDFQNNVIYLKPNSLMNAPYTDAKKSI